MGLDAVEIILEIEEVFSITIPDDVASRMLTVGDVHDYIVAKTNVPTRSQVCLSAMSFYSIRRVAQSLGIDRRLRPRDSTLRLFPERYRRSFWKELQSAAQLKLPTLRRPTWMVAAATCAALASAAWAGVAVHGSTASRFAAFACAVGIAATTGSLFALLTVPFAVHPAKHFLTLRELAASALSLNFQSLAERYQGAHANDVWIALRAIIVEQLGVPTDKVTPTASFVNDLGCT